MDISQSGMAEGFFGNYGGQFVPDTMKSALHELAETFSKCRHDPEFQAEFAGYLEHFAGRPSPLFFCKNLSEMLGGARIFLKREDLNHLGAHKVNNTIGQILVAKRMGKKRIIAETGAGQHGVAAAATAALMGMQCTIFMGEEDTHRQHLNVVRMRMLGAEVVSVKDGQRTLKEAVDAALAEWIRDPEAFYLLGSAVGPHPYPIMVQEFQSVIGIEARDQMLQMEKRLPDACIACVGGGSNAIGIFSGFLQDKDVRLIGVEPAGRSLTPGNHAASLCCGKPGIMHGFRSYMIQNEKGEPGAVYSISAGLDYPSVGPAHAWLKDTGRAEYVTITDNEAVHAFHELSRHEGIIPALESAHALAKAMQIAPNMAKDAILLVCLSGRGDKDVEQIAAMEKA